MDTHPVDPVALIAGLLFSLSGAAIIAERNWDDLDVTAFTAAGVAVVGLLLAAVIVSRYVRDAIRASGEFEPTAPGVDDDETLETEA